MNVTAELDRHQARRQRGMACVSLLTGPYSATWAVLKKWADSSDLLTANVRASGIRAVLAAYEQALLRLGDLRSTVLAIVSPRTAEQPRLDQRTWEALTPLERSEVLARWPADEVTKGIVTRLLIRTEGISPPLLGTLEELGTVTRLLGCPKSPMLVVTVTELSAAADLSYLLEIADQIPTIPIALLADHSTFKAIQEAAERGDRVAAFIRDGTIVIARLSELTTALPPDKLVTLPTNVADRVRSLDAEGVNERVLDAFVAASTIDPNAEPNTFDSRAEEFLSMLLEGDPRTAGLFTSQGQPGFRMHNNQLATVDFLCSSLGIAVEVDGPHHLLPDQFRRDRRKDRELQKAGYLILRFLAEDVTMHFEEVRTQIQAAVDWKFSSTDGAL
jgi:hypothetical protein